MFGNLTTDGRHWPTRSQVRNALARVFRASPYFPGKQHLSALLNQRLTDGEDDRQALVTVRLREGSLLRLDLRSATEWPAFWSGVYDRQTLDLLLPYLPPRAVVLDVGANIGFYAVPLGRYLRRRGGRVYAVEPFPANYARLVENVGLNRLGGVVQPRRLALGAQEGTAHLQCDAASAGRTGNAAVVAPDRCRHDAEAPLTTLDRFAAAEGMTHCHLIKVDVEGEEFAFLQGGRAALARWRPLVLCEINPFWMARRGWSMTDLLKLCRELDYQTYRRRDGRWLPMAQGRDLVEDVLLAPVESRIPARMTGLTRSFHGK